jgi:phosphatidylserine synthase
VVLQLGVLFDHMDGTLARYRRRLTALGSLYDKVSDLLTWTVIVLAIAWVASERSGAWLPFLLAAISTNAQAAMGYMKWVAHAESERIDWRRAKEDPDNIIAAKSKPPTGSEPPERSRGDWLRWFGRTMLNIFIPQEMDLFLWVGLLLLFDQHLLALWALVAVNGAGLLIMCIIRGWQMRKLDRRR